jgi:hypothetical protein
MTYTTRPNHRGYTRWTAASLSRGAAVVAFAATFVIATVIAPAGAFAQATARYVSPAGDDANPGTLSLPFATIQHAVNASADGDSVMLADGEYSGPGNRDIDMLGKAIRVASISMDPELCVINCADPDSTPHIGFIFNGFYNDRPELAGLTVTGATTTSANQGAIQLPGDGLVSEFPADSPNADNPAQEMAPTGAAPILRRVNVISNVGNGFYVGTNRTVFTAYDCSFSDNTGHGGGTNYASSSRGEFFDCRFERNGGAGMSYGASSWGPARVPIIRCRFTGNAADGFMGGMSYTQSLEFDECEFTTNGGNGITLRYYGRITRSLVADNGGWGLDHIISESDPTMIVVEGCEVLRNQLGGIRSKAYLALHLGGANINATLVSNNGGPGIVGMVNTTPKSITDCVITDNGGAAIVLHPSVRVDNPYPTESRFTVARTTITSNTGAGLICRYVEGHVPPLDRLVLSVDHSIFCFQDTVATFVGPLPDSLSVSCTDIFGNTAGDWVGPLAPFANTAGNLSVDPLFCADANPSDPWTLHADSPLAAENNVDCGQIGARGAACASTVVACRSIHVYDPVTGAYDPAQLNRIVTVEGVVYVAPGTYSETGGGYLQDETGGINFWRSPVPANVNVGDRLRITGPIWPWAGELHIGTYTYTKLDSLQTSTPVPYALADLLDDFSNTGSHVSVTGTISGLTTDTFQLVAGTRSIEVRRNAYGLVDFGALTEGSLCTVSGPCFKQEGALYLMPPSQDCITTSRLRYVAVDGDDANPGSPSLPFATIQHAVNASADGDSVMLADGEYSGPGNRDIDMLGKAIRVASISMDPELCVINCAEPDSTPHIGFIFSGNYNGRPELAGVTVTGATTDEWNRGAILLPLGGSVVDASSTQGSADASEQEMAAIYGMAPILRNVHVENNRGDGFYVDRFRTGFTAYDCSFSNNTGNGGASGGSSVSGDFFDCRFNGNGGSGLVHGGVRWSGPVLAQIQRCQFNGNGMHGYSSGACETARIIEFDGCEFIGNMGNGIFDAYGARVTSSLIADNGGWGLVYRIMSVDPSFDTLIECEVLRNQDGGIWCDSRSARCWGGVSVSGCLVADNGGPGIVGAMGCSPGSISDCVVSGNLGPAIVLNSIIPADYWQPVQSRFSIEGNTIVESAGPGLHCRFGTGYTLGRDTLKLSLLNSIICRQDTAMTIDGSQPDTLLVACTDIFGNTTGDWVGPLASFANTAGNLSVDPEFCAPDTGDYHLQADSPLAAANNIVCGTIGRLDVNCPADPGSSGVTDLPATTFVVAQNVPNPFNPFTTIRFNLPASAPVTAGVFDLAGRRIRALVSGVTMGAGPHELTWDGRDDAGRQAPSGSYHFRLEAAGESRTMRMMLLK